MDMGWIIALSMLTTAVLSITVLPAVLSLVKPKIPETILLLNRIAGKKGKVHTD
jgi:Cu/Ag efflux pump CusA